MQVHNGQLMAIVDLQLMAMAIISLLGLRVLRRVSECSLRKSYLVVRGIEHRVESLQKSEPVDKVEAFARIASELWEDTVRTAISS